ncbi:hypothetical protein ACLXBB_37275, partial [Pseudomonas aeruginosa]
AKYPLSPAMWRFVEHSRAFASDSPRLDAQRAAYARMCQAKYPLSPAMWRFVEHSRAFASDSPRLDAQRAAY